MKLMKGIAFRSITLVIETPEEAEVLVAALNISTYDIQRYKRVGVTINKHVHEEMHGLVKAALMEED